MIITEKDSSFKDYYLKCVEIPHFKTALLGKEIPNIGSILIKDKQIISLCARDEKNSLTYRASLLLAKRLGFKIIESNLTCDIIEYRL